MYHIDEFLDHLRDRRLKPTTLAEYRRLLDSLARDLTERGRSHIRAAAREDVVEYLAARRKAGVGDKDVYVAFLRLRRYFAFLEAEGIVFLSPMHGLEPPKRSAHSYPALSADRMEEILSRVRIARPVHVKGRAILELGYSSALRPREMYGLRISDIDFARGLLFIHRSKGEKDRLVPVGTRALSWIHRYIGEIRTRYASAKSQDFAFISHTTGAQLTRWGIRAAIRTTLLDSGLDPIKPASLRPTAATALLSRGMDLAYISRLLGHVDVRTTQLYLRVWPTELTRVMAEHHPRRLFADTNHDTQKEN